MSFRAKMTRVTYIDSRLRHVRDYPSSKDLVAGLWSEYGETPSTKTIQRDIEWMRDQGAPIEYHARRHGYFYAHEDWKLPAIDITEGDLLAMLVAERALAGYRNSPYYAQLRSIFDRLTRLLPENVTIASEDLAHDITVISEAATRIDGEVWKVVRESLHDHRRLAIHYKAPAYDSPAIRIVDPLHIVGHRGEWYMLCWSHHHEQIRIFALARITEAHPRRERFERPAHFDPADYIDPAFGIYVSESAEDVVVRFDGDAAVRIAERQWHPDQVIDRHASGAITVSFRTNQQSQVLYWVSQWGPNAEILEPPELRERAREWFAETARRYSQD